VGLRPRRGSLVAPLGVAAARRGAFVVTDAAAGRVYRLAPGAAALDGFATTVAWRQPVGVAVDTVRGRVVVADAGDHVVRVLDTGGNLLFTIGSRGSGPGEFNYPTFVAVAPDGRIVVVDAMNFRIQVFAPDGGFIRTFGSAGDATGYFAAPKGVCVDPDDHLIVADARFSAVHLYDLEGRLLLAIGHYGDAPDAFALPTGVACDQAGRFYVADTWNGRVSVFEVRSPAEERR
jgi:DNA-binding beta-propeller fold protein YncE